ncbi:hypothetical protein LIER_04390 [Lithospermum erythrorhizon]|uniref:Uncharacterized protein n=1 Tax=Lithospermum erythrorhizon TaxID=34254 RepID=A0AAV3P192_LITER
MVIYLLAPSLGIFAEDYGYYNHKGEVVDWLDMGDIKKIMDTIIGVEVVDGVDIGTMKALVQDEVIAKLYSDFLEIARDCKVFSEEERKKVDAAYVPFVDRFQLIL